jgi:hypothetical protein
LEVIRSKAAGRIPAEPMTAWLPWAETSANRAGETEWPVEK